MIAAVCVTQRVLSRQEELKERARLLLEQARRDAAIKASNKNNPSSAANVANRTTNACDVSLSDFNELQSRAKGVGLSPEVREEGGRSFLPRVGTVSACLFAPCWYSIAPLCWNS